MDRGAHSCVGILQRTGIDRCEARRSSRHAAADDAQRRCGRGSVRTRIFRGRIYVPRARPEARTAADAGAHAGDAPAASVLEIECTPIVLIL